MKCVLLAAGEGTRMRPLTSDTPKPLLSVLGRSLMDYHFAALPKEIDEVVVVVGYLGDKIRRYLGSEFQGKKISYIVQDKPLGTYHAVQLCESLVGGDFFVMYADDLIDPSGIRACINSGSITMLVASVLHPERFGIVNLNEDGTVREIEEKPKKPKGNLANCGPCMLNRDIFRFPPPPSHKNESFLTDSLALMLKAGYTVKSVIAGWYMPIGYPEDLIKAEALLKSAA